MSLLKYSVVGLFLPIALTSCLFPQETDYPQVSTSAVTNITETSVQCGGIVTDDGNADIAERGVCWNPLFTPSIFDAHTSDGSGDGDFTSYVTGLQANTTYYISAYATNSEGTSYGEVLTFTTSSGGGGGGTVTDYDGNTYQTIQIGSQVWMTENLKVTHYRNGDPIEYVSDASAWSSASAGSYCNYDNMQSNSDTYGRLYNWAVVNDSRNIAPAGWHVPTYNEWLTLIAYLGGASTAGGKMKETGTIHWLAPNPASNSSGFTALPSGLRDQTGSFFAMNYNGYWWSSTVGDASYAWGAALSYSDENANTVVYLKQLGFPIRCIKD